MTRPGSTYALNWPLCLNDGLTHRPRTCQRKTQYTHLAKGARSNNAPLKSYAWPHRFLDVNDTGRLPQTLKELEIQE